MIKLPKTDPIPAPEPATPTVAAPAPMNLAAESMSLLTALLWKPRVTCVRNGEDAGIELCGTISSPLLRTVQLSGLANVADLVRATVLAAGARYLAQEYIV